METFFHTFLDIHHKPRPRGGDGYTEWYNESAFEDLQTFLQQTLNNAWVQRVGEPAQPSGTTTLQP
jgi:hypothetical protein